jgi:hypothetical protein
MHLQIRFLTSTVSSGISSVHQPEEVDAFVFDSDNAPIDDLDPHVMPKFYPHILDSVPASCEDFDDHQVKAISTAIVALDSNEEAWVALFYQKRTNASYSWLPPSWRITLQ